MITLPIELTNRLGLHARPSAKLAKTASLFKSSITLSRPGQTVDAKSILGLMTMACPQGTSLTLQIDGPDEDAAAVAIRELFESRFGEE